MAIHHIIPKHEWKARFGNLEGFNAPDNRSPELYNHQHAQVHLHYFAEITHLEYDRIAGLAISGQIGKEELFRQLSSVANSGRPHTEAHIKKQAASQKGSQKPPHTELWKLNHSQKMKGIQKIQVSCVCCRKSGGINTMSRWHFENCKYKKV